MHLAAAPLQSSHPPCVHCVHCDGGEPREEGDSPGLEGGPESAEGVGPGLLGCGEKNEQVDDAVLQGVEVLQDKGGDVWTA